MATYTEAPMPFNFGIFDEENITTTTIRKQRRNEHPVARLEVGQTYRRRYCKRTASVVGYWRKVGREYTVEKTNGIMYITRTK